ncbi:CheY chemotaxis protein or a CheY-like REC (receiver) domain [Marinitoga hydrogenitolerans DSM 16785]|uniref:CheY chemotaxis protein or a CheY-like REC (Receiver) domain n=1 Tax=Marinitoga hydrogenitolerans (strain DSM 16785 / JCM 12826 / AT1271) TaxID=1122195 RepID=A0A1M4UJ51_MARH1|nr:response regulator [Marinitoga hydrogenitolerans]SHE56766.1 CheY chemotaxis protein or a CheY-like REC (receiver) domain [Marinitoga hydrogenitolerans DSM 16785]
MKILHIDDSNLSLKMLRVLLESHFENTEIISIKPDKYKEHKAKFKKYDMIIIDLTMPVISGFEIIEDLKKENIDIFKVVYSSNVQNIVKKRLSKDINLFLEKPANKEQIKLLKRMYELWKEKK